MESLHYCKVCSLPRNNAWVLGLHPLIKFHVPVMCSCTFGKNHSITKKIVSNIDIAVFAGS